MADCVLAAEVLDRTILAAAVESRTELAAAVASRVALVAAVESRVEIAAAVESRTELVAAVESRTEIAAAVERRVVLVGEVRMPLDPQDREKLDSIEYGARASRPDFVRLAYATETTTGGGSETGGGVGDSVQWTGSAEWQETIRFLVPTPSWRSNGYLELDFTAAFLNGSGDGSQAVSFKLQRSYAPPTTPGTDPALYGLPLAWADVAGASWTSLGIPAGAGTGSLTFLLRIRATGHTGAASKHVYSGAMTASNLGGGAPVLTPFVGRLATSGASPPYNGLDVTEDLLLRVLFRMAPPWDVAADAAFNVTSGSAILVPREDHPF